ncbi:class E sortase [Streptomyces sp. NPDC051320]|uniref:class E sortase n=1 Tax=Streptomyces sp. NPDC051320 TaxID=3154644 RepID=UPI0034431549
MTASRPGHDGSTAPGRPGDGGPDGTAGASHAYDPLTDPLPPGTHGSRGAHDASGTHGSPWFGAEHVQLEQPVMHDPPPDWYGREAFYQPVQEPVGQPAPEPATQIMPALFPDPATAPGADRGPAPGTEPAFTSPRDNETVALRVPGPAVPQQPMPEPAAPIGGRAQRRKAAKGRGHKGGATAEPVIPAIPRTRIEARRAARALKDSPAVIASRAIGEIFISLGVLMLLFVTYQLWWTNVRAHQEANGTAHSLQEDWAKGGSTSNQPGAFEPGQGFAIIHIPKLDVVVPIAEGVSKHKVLDRGMVGHYSEGKLKTAMPSARTGNFALAGHRNTHGEPFRYINKLKNGDKVVVETKDDYYTYEVTSHLAQTSPSNVSVITPVPPGSGFTGPGRYITLTTCTPEFTSTYRMVVWGKMVDERPRSKGMPKALTAG